MAGKQEIPVLVAAENLCFHTMKICNNINNFPKKWRYTLVDNGKKRSYRRKFNRLCKKVKNGELPLEVLEKSYKSWSEHASFATDKSIFDYYIKRIKELKNDN